MPLDPQFLMAFTCIDSLSTAQKIIDDVRVLSRFADTKHEDVKEMLNAVVFGKGLDAYCDTDVQCYEKTDLLRLKTRPID